MGWDKCELRDGSREVVLVVFWFTIFKVRELFLFIVEIK